MADRIFEIKDIDFSRIIYKKKKASGNEHMTKFFANLEVDGKSYPIHIETPELIAPFTRNSQKEYLEKQRNQNQNKNDKQKSNKGDYNKYDEVPENDSFTLPLNLANPSTLGKESESSKVSANTLIDKDVVDFTKFLCDLDKFNVKTLAGDSTYFFDDEKIQKLYKNEEILGATGYKYPIVKKSQNADFTSTFKVKLPVKDGIDLRVKIYDKDLNEIKTIKLNENGDKVIDWSWSVPKMKCISLLRYDGLSIDKKNIVYPGFTAIIIMTLPSLANNINIGLMKGPKKYKKVEVEDENEADSEQNDNEKGNEKDEKDGKDGKDENKDEDEKDEDEKDENEDEEKTKKTNKTKKSNLPNIKKLNINNKENKNIEVSSDEEDDDREDDE